jgi:hypothetical protein
MVGLRFELRSASKTNALSTTSLGFQLKTQSIIAVDPVLGGGPQCPNHPNGRWEKVVRAV